MEGIIYLDNAATTFPKPEEVYDYMDSFYRNYGANAGRGGHSLSRMATKIIDETRELLCDLVDYNKLERVIFTPSATIALNQILRGLDWSTIHNVYISPFEHNAVVRTLYSLKQEYSFNIFEIEFNKFTFELDYQRLSQMMAHNKPDLFVLTHISNVLGLILPIEEIIIAGEKYQPITVIDCSQSLGLVPISITKASIDFIVFAGHKTLYGPFGASGYIDNSDIELKCYITGGTGSDSTNIEMPKSFPLAYEAGSLNIQAIAGLNASLKWINKIGVSNIYFKKKELTEQLIKMLLEIEDIELYLPNKRDKHIGIIPFNVKGYLPDQLAYILDCDYNIAVRAGHHCAPKIGSFLEASFGTVRASLGYFNTFEDIKKLYEAIEEIIEG